MAEYYTTKPWKLQKITAALRVKKCAVIRVKTLNESQKLMLKFLLEVVCFHTAGNGTPARLPLAYKSLYHHGFPIRSLPSHNSFFCLFICIVEMGATKCVDGPAIGIDLGTTYSCVAVWRPVHNRVEVIPNYQGNLTTPSCIAFTNDGLLVGEGAVNQAANNPVNTIFGENRIPHLLVLATLACILIFTAI
jgi:hypothetical protein